MKIESGFVLTASVISLVISACQSQQLKHHHRVLAKRMQDTIQNAYWVAMMDDSTCTYQAAVSAFDLYWKHREKPVDPDLNEGKDIFENDSSEAFEKRDLSLVWEYKCFLNWQKESRYLLKPDGKVMTPSDILKQWHSTQKDSIKR